MAMTAAMPERRRRVGRRGPPVREGFMAGSLAHPRALRTRRTPDRASTSHTPAAPSGRPGYPRRGVLAACPTAARTWRVFTAASVALPPVRGWDGDYACRGIEGAGVRRFQGRYRIDLARSQPVRAAPGEIDNGGGRHCAARRRPSLPWSHSPEV